MNALADGGAAALTEAERLVPGIAIDRYAAADMESGEQLDRTLDGAVVVLVHEWNEPWLVAAIGRRRRHRSFQLFFLDAHHRAVTRPDEIAAFELENYDGVLAFGETLREVYARNGWGRRVFTWHEAADTALFRPLDRSNPDWDLIWIGNWGDEERTSELSEFLIEPASHLRLRTRIHGVRYPEPAQALLRDRGIDYAGWLLNHHVPAAFARARVTVHIPRRAYQDILPGIPTIRVFEALACGIPLVSSPWSDAEGLFPRGCYLQVSNGVGMTAALKKVLADRAMAAEMTRKGLAAIQSAHTCRHRVDELLAIVRSLAAPASRTAAQSDPPHSDAPLMRAQLMEARP
jgi:spore maturation protein CgeB